MYYDRARVRLQFILHRFIGREVIFTPRTALGARLIAEGRTKGVILNVRRGTGRLIYELDLSSPGRPLRIETTKRTFTVAPGSGAEE